MCKYDCIWRSGIFGWISLNAPGGRAQTIQQLLVGKVLVKKNLAVCPDQADVRSIRPPGNHGDKLASTQAAHPDIVLSVTWKSASGRLGDASFRLYLGGWPSPGTEGLASFYQVTTTLLSVSELFRYFRGAFFAAREIRPETRELGD